MNNKLDFEKDSEYQRDMENYGMSFEEWITLMEENADKLEKEYYINSQKEIIDKFKEKYPNGAKLDIDYMSNEYTDIDYNYDSEITEEDFRSEPTYFMKKFRGESFLQSLNNEQLNIFINAINKLIK